MAFSFHARCIDIDDTALRLSFANQDGGSGQRYFIIERSEDDRDSAVSDMANIYIERDDQTWGGYGGIESVVLDRNGLTVRLGPRMAAQLGQQELISVEFELNASEFDRLRDVLQRVMRGYENRLDCRP